MAMTLNYRGMIRKKEANAVTWWLRHNKKMTFVEWSPSQIDIGINREKIVVNKEIDELIEADRSVVMIGNNTAIGRVFEQRIGRVFDNMFACRSFVHWYKREGMEEDEFIGARENLAFLEFDYLDALTEMSTDAAISDSDYY